MKDMNKLNDKVLENVAGGRLTENEAIEKALAFAGIARSQVDFIKRVEMDYECGRLVYDIKFYHGGLEYDFDVDAENGSILQFEKDYD